MQEPACGQRASPLFCHTRSIGIRKSPDPQLHSLKSALQEAVGARAGGSCVVFLGSLELPGHGACFPRAFLEPHSACESLLIPQLKYFFSVLVFV